jgi:hypothetical protein
MAGLVAVVVVTAVSSSAGAPRGAILVRSAHGSDPANPSPDRLRLGACRTAGGLGGSSLRLEEQCGGRLTGNFTCVNEGEDQALSIRRPVADGAAFYLTIVIPEFEGPGDYSQDDVSAQLVGRGETLRWTNLNDGVEIDATRPGRYELAQGALLPEPGTPTTGVITLSGSAVCR